MAKRRTSEKTSLLPQETIENKIFLIRGKKVMLDEDLARLYAVTTKSINRAVKRNPARFPDDFMFRLNREENESLRYQFGTSKRGGRRYFPYAFTEHGILMLSSVLNSEHAVQVNIAIMRVFVKLKEVLSAHKELAYKFKELEQRIEKHDEEIIAIFEAIRQLMEPPLEGTRERIGF